MPAGWKNPIRRVKAPKLPTEPIEPIQMEDINLLLKTCESNYSGVRDKAMMLGLLDTGARAKEFLNINLEDVELETGSIMIRQGKGRKPRMVFLGRKTIRAIRGYLPLSKGANTLLFGFHSRRKDDLCRLTPPARACRDDRWKSPLPTISGVPLPGRCCAK
ncbi:MAG: tyrosine-type recombinase/integrase [Anaerolineales bacterium]|nr:tyrosine-type recombinase/integrase [Anaerolineales bacterium]